MKYLLALLALVCAPQALAGDEEHRPSGQNCNLSAPPADAGEEGGHGFILLVYPRSKDVRAAYSGCQAVFVTDRTGTTRLLWLVEVTRGDPVRIWSSDNDMKDMMACRYQRGKVVRGNPQTCTGGKELLIPTQPAGCFTKSSKGPGCDYDMES